MTTTDAAKLREDAERLYDWYLPNGHPDRGIYGTNPWRLDDWDIAYIKRDEAIQRLVRHVLATVPEDGGREEFAAGDEVQIVGPNVVGEDDQRGCICKITIVGEKECSVKKGGWMCWYPKRSLAPFRLGIQPTKPGDKVLVEAVYERPTSKGAAVRWDDCDFGSALGHVPLSAIRPFPQEEE